LLPLLEDDERLAPLEPEVPISEPASVALEVLVVPVVPVVPDVPLEPRPAFLFLPNIFTSFKA
jgi:hypothetical protein